LITQLGLVKPVVMGHSMGAQMAMHAAGLFPELLRAVVMERPADVPDVVPTAAEIAEGKQRRNGWIDSLKALSHEQLVLRCIAENPTWRAESFIILPNQSINLVLSMIPSLSVRSWQKLIPQIGVPALLIGSDPSKGSIVPAAAAAEARVLSAQIEVALNPQCGALHSPLKHRYNIVPWCTSFRTASNQNRLG
jgi:pimeloyl-ACP methyl ester carboxylesterase